MEVYDENLTIKAALAQLFERFGFPADAYAAKWFAVGIGKIQVWMPNLPSRVKAVRFHDVHHVLTGYPANWKGEVEIGAWEIATGCTTFWVAWFLNLGSLMMGLVLYPRALWKAFQRGWRTRTNLYHDFEYEPLLALTVKELREKIGLSQ
ncbi:MAG: hypothetical protein AAB316_01235 [Bacteroidota bacterium]